MSEQTMIAVLPRLSSITKSAARSISIQIKPKLNKTIQKEIDAMEVDLAIGTIPNLPPRLDRVQRALEQQQAQQRAAAEAQARQQQALQQQQAQLRAVAEARARAIAAQQAAAARQRAIAAQQAAQARQRAFAAQWAQRQACGHPGQPRCR